MKLLIFYAIGVFVFIGQASIANASLLYNQTYDSSQTGYIAWWSGNEIVDDFTLTSDAHITDMQFYGGFSGNWDQQDGNVTDTGNELYTSLFFVSIYSDVAGVPGNSPIFSGSIYSSGTDTGANSAHGGDDILEFSGQLLSGGFDLAADTQYWVNIVRHWEGDPAGVGSFFWQASDFTPDGYLAQRLQLTGDPWETFSNADGNELAFSFSGTVVPVPASVWLFGSGLISLLGLVRQKKTQLYGMPAYPDTHLKPLT